MLGTWWRERPHVIRQVDYAPYRGEGFRPMKVTAEVIACTGKQVTRYEPIGHPEILDAILDVAQGRLKPTEFADHFGLLGYNYVVPRENACPGGDPLGWFLAHAQTARTIATLIELMQEARSQESTRRLATYLREEILDGPYALAGQIVRIPFKSVSSTVFRALGIVRYLMNENLGETRRQFQMTEKRGLRTIFVFRNLAQVIYWQLADRLANRSLRRCQECGRIFTHPNARMRFCPPAKGQTISPCKSRWNVREFRRRQRKRKTKKGK